jgi:hypothetical protein
MRYLSRISAWRRELNSHEAAEPRDDRRLPNDNAIAALRARKTVMDRTRFLSISAANRNDLRPSHNSGRPYCKPNMCFQSVGGAAERGTSCVAHVFARRRQEPVAGQAWQRGAGGFSAATQITVHLQAGHRSASIAALPNPSLKRSANGRPPGPGRWYSVHFHRPGPGVLPLSPA